MPFDFPKFIISLLLVGAFMSVDLWTKHEVRTSTVHHEKTIGLGEEITITRPITNYGGPGVFSNDASDWVYRLWHVFVVLISLLCYSVMVLFNDRHWHSVIGAISVGGMWGNSFELITRGGVTDFIQFSGSGILDGFVWNVADIFIIIGLPIYYLTDAVQPYVKLVYLVISVSIFSVTIGFLPSDPFAFFAIGGLFLLLFWPDATEERI